jgi:tetraacyldisaccharide 4'-kinase
LGPFSAIYSLALKCRRFCYDHLKKPDRLPAKVVSIGNITLGGTGKTPAVIALAIEARKRGLNPCVLTRGYKGSAKETCFISKGEAPLLDAGQAGDEAFLMAKALKGVPVVKGSNRFRAGIMALEYDQLAIVNLPQSRLFLLDDGFQHWRLNRDMDIVLIDATNPFGNRKLFPEGIMREPFSALGRANIILITKSDVAGESAVSAITRDIRKYNEKAPVFNSFHKPAAVINSEGEERSPDSLRQKKVYAFAGIANPAYFQATLRSVGADIINFRKFRDHHVYTQKEVDEIKKDARGLEIITTEKDLVKLRELELPENISALKIEFSVDQAFYDHIFKLLEYENKINPLQI